MHGLFLGSPEIKGIETAARIASSGFAVEIKAPNAKTRKAMAELEAGKSKRPPLNLGWPIGMGKIERASTFRLDYKRIRNAPRHRKDGEALVEAVLALLITDESLPERCSDHALTGNWAGYRECHLKPDLLLIYSKPDTDTLRLARLGSHSELFG